MLANLMVYLFPLTLVLFFPSMQDMYDTPRWMILGIWSLLLLVATLFGMLKTKRVAKSFSPTAIGFFALALAATASVVVVSANKVEALLHPLGAVTYFTLSLIAAFLPTLLTKAQKDRMAWVVLALIAALGLVVLYQQFGITSILFPNNAYLQSNLWNPTGTPISAALLFFFAIPLGIARLQEERKNSRERGVAFAIVFLVLSVAGLCVTLWRFLPLVPTVVMPISVGWTVLMETMKNLKAAALGFGAENFGAAYALGRPASVNLTALWNTGFTTSATTLLHVATTIGLAGVAGLGIFAVVWLKDMPKHTVLKMTWILVLVALVFFPPSIPFLLLIVLLDVLYGKNHVNTYELNSLATVLFSVILSGVIALSSYGLYRAASGELLFSRARTAAEKENNLTKSYTLHIKAIQQNNQMTRYHTSLSQLALIIANSILQTAPVNTDTGVVTLLEEDKKLVTSLFGLAVSEAKLATTLAPESYATWVNLASVYQSLVGVANDATTWTTAAYQKAITLNPISPALRIDFGGVYVNAKDYDRAIEQFFTATTLKGDYANAYYNLANAYRLKGDAVHTLEALLQTQTLIPTTSADYQKLSEEIAQLQTQTPETVQPTPTPTKRATPTTSIREPLVIPE